jgi:hypothetical protein
VFSIVGPATIEGGKSELDLVRNATAFRTTGAATLDLSSAPDRLDVRGMPFEWARRGWEDLLLNTTVKGHALQIVVTSIELRTNGLWQGRPLESETDQVKL